MRLRDESASAYESVFVVTGLTDAAAARAPEAFAALIAQPDATPVRRRHGGSNRDSAYLPLPEARSLVPRNVHVADPSLTDEEVFGLLARTPLIGLPASILVAGDRVALKTWHGELDGVWTLEVLHRLLEGCAGRSSPPWPRPVRFPLLRIAARSRVLGAVRAFLVHRRENSVAVEPAAPPTTAQLERRNVRLLGSTLDAQTVQAVRCALGDESVNSRLAAVVATTAERIYHGPGSPPVSIPVHLGRWAGGPVSGNVIHNVRVGGLRSADLSAARIHSLLATGSSPVGVAGWFWDLQWPLKARLRRRSPEAATVGELTVQISMIRSPRPLPVEAWRRGIRVKFGSIGPYPAFFTLLWRHGDQVILTVQDETCRFDTSRYLHVLHGEIDRLVKRRFESATAS